MNIDTIPCVFKKRVELRASEDLRSISEQCTVSGWRNTNAKILENFDTVLQDSRDDLSSVMHKMLVTEKDNTRNTASKTPLSAWQVCFSAKQHQGGYQLEPEGELVQSKWIVDCGKNAHIFTPPRCHCNLNITKENVDENSCVERNTARNGRAKSATYVDQSNSHTQDGGKLTRITRSASSSPHTGYKFCHSKATDYYTKSYREQITNDNIRKHIQWQLKENNRNNAKKSPKRTHEAKSKAIPIPAFYSFRISKDKNPCDSGYLKVGPSPRRSEQKESKKAGVKTFNTVVTQSGKGKTTNIASEEEEKKVKGKEIKSVTTLKFQNTQLSQRENTVPGVDSEGNAEDTTKTESSEGKLKKVQLKVQNSSTDSPRIVPKNGRANKTKVSSTDGIALFCYNKTYNF